MNAICLEGEPEASVSISNENDLTLKYFFKNKMQSQMFIFLHVN
jgi:hypothetical protein